MPRSSTGLAREESRVVGVRCPNDLADAWAAYSQVNPDAAELLRDAMRGILNTPIPSRSQRALPVDFDGERSYQDTSDVDRSPRKSLKLSITASEHLALSSIAEERGCSIQFWIVGLVRAALTKGVTFGGEELKLLGKSNYQLMAIGRNLNQVAHQLNADPARHLHRVTVRRIDQLAAAIDNHRGHVHRLVESCSHRWTLTTSTKKDANGR